jgi:hypothetical protein
MMIKGEGEGFDLKAKEQSRAKSKFVLFSKRHFLRFDVLLLLSMLSLSMLSLSMHSFPTQTNPTQTHTYPPPSIIAL